MTFWAGNLLQTSGNYFLDNQEKCNPSTNIAKTFTLSLFVEIQNGCDKSKRQNCTLYPSVVSLALVQDHSTFILTVQSFGWTLGLSTYSAVEHLRGPEWRRVVWKWTFFHLKQAACGWHHPKERGVGAVADPPSLGKPATCCGSTVQVRLIWGVWILHLHAQ